jgi:hypothetical protein
MVAEMPVEWQMDIALAISKFVLAYDKNLTMTLDEQKAERDREIEAAINHERRGAGVTGRASDQNPEGRNDSAVQASAAGQPTPWSLIYDTRNA